MSILIEHPVGQINKVVGLYQTLLRRHLEHFFPDAILEPGGDRSFIDWSGAPGEANYRFAADPEGIGVEIEWFRTRYLFLPGSPTPFLPSERRLIEMVLEDRSFSRVTAQEILDLVQAQGTLEEAQEMAEGYAAEAKRELQFFPPSDTRDALELAPDFVLNRRS